MEKIKDILAENLRFLREARGWTQGEAATKAKIPFPTYRNFEQSFDKRPTFPRQEQISALAAAFGVRESSLFIPQRAETRSPSNVPPEIQAALEKLYERNDPYETRGILNYLLGIASEEERHLLLSTKASEERSDRKKKSR